MNVSMNGTKAEASVHCVRENVTMGIEVTRCDNFTAYAVLVQMGANREVLEWLVDDGQRPYLAATLRRLADEIDADIIARERAVAREAAA